MKLEKAWVTKDGEFGGGPIFFIDSIALNIQQWDNLANMAASDRWDYVENILNVHDMNVREIEMENFGVEWGL